MSEDKKNDLQKTAFYYDNNQQYVPNNQNIDFENLEYNESKLS